jgi:putative hydrolase of the HAD superfamily
VAASHSFELVLFDLGGVLIELRGVGAMQEMTGGMAVEELWRRWLSCPWVRSFESGQCSPEAFAEGIVAQWSLSTPPDEFLASFRSWPTGPLPGAEDLVRDVAEVVEVGCLSNTNRLHWSDWADSWPLLDLIKTRFLSFQIGLLKPDREVFDHVIARLGLDPRRILFLDDNQLNIDSAVDAGLQAVRVEGVIAARQALQAAGVL